MPKKKAKRRRLPNGFGQISEIKGQNLRNPFRAMITVGKNENGRPICKPLKPEAYFQTYNEAYEALMEYHKSPYEQASNITMQDLYAQWSEWYFKRIKSKSASNITAVWKYCHPVYDIKATDLRPKHIRSCIEEAYKVDDDNIIQATIHIKNRMKTLFNMLLDYAVEYEITDRNYARDMKLPTNDKEINQSHMPFTDDEMNTLWSNISIPFVKVILVNCYSGWRPSEICRLELTNTNIKEWYFKGGIKTEAGKNRIVPIHTSIRPMVKEFYNIAVENDSKYLFNIKRKRGDHYNQYSDITSYHAYRYFFLDVVNRLKLNPNHRPHDCRKHFVTMAKRNHVDEYAIKYIVGHKISDVTERVYTERETTWLLQEIEKIKGPVEIA